MKNITNENLVYVGNKIKKIRESKNLSQEEVAKKASMERKHLSDIENAQQNFTLRTLYKIANALEICPSELLKND